MLSMQNRRRFLAGISAAGLAGLPRSAHAEPPAEITTLRLPFAFRSLCEAPKNVAGELLRAEGFTDVRYVEPPPAADWFALLANGDLDFNTDFAPPHITAIEAGLPVKVLAGLHSGCLELIANDSVRGIADLKGKRVGVFSSTSAPHTLVTLMAAYVGLDPARDIQWVESPDVAAPQLFIEGKIDAFLGTPPEPQEMRAAKMGHTILNTTTDRPWSEHFCCVVIANREFVRKHPVATKRALRAILKAADICSEDPQRAARLMRDRGYEPRYDIALEVVKSLPYRRWREANPEDTLRFHALRLHEFGMIKTTPQKLIARGTDWRFLNELKKELKA